MPGNKLKDKRRTKQRSRARRYKYDYGLQYDDEDVEIHSKAYKYNNETRMLVFNNPDLMNIILGYLGYNTFLFLGMVSKTFYELLKNNMDYFMNKTNTDYWKKYQVNLYRYNYKKWKKNDELLESIFAGIPKMNSAGYISGPITYTWNIPQNGRYANKPPELESYKDLVYTTGWFYNHEFLEIYKNNKKRYPSLSVYKIFVKTVHHFTYYLTGLKFCDRCYNNWRWDRPEQDLCNCELQNNIYREFYFS